MSRKYDLSPEAVRKHNAEVYEKANASQRAIIDEVQKEFDASNESFFGDDTFAKERQLRDWGRKFFDSKYINISDIENLQQQSSFHGPGKIFIFEYKNNHGTRVNVRMITTPAGTIEKVDNYIYLLETTVINLQNTLDQKQFTKYSFLDLIKLAFKQLIGRNHGK